MTERILRHLRFNILFLLALPSTFALGWYVRGTVFDRDVQNAARKIVVGYDGEFVPELGLIVGGNKKELLDRMNEIKGQTTDEAELRALFFKRLQTRNREVGGTTEGITEPKAP